MCMIDLEPCELWVENERKARKHHKCDSCQGAILVGERYICHFNKFDGNITYAKMCLACRDDRKLFADAHDGTLMDPGHFSEMVQECIGEDKDSEAMWKPMLERIEARAKK